ncbi:HAD family hydrolase [Desulfoluna spongiiphila]|uniref:phosphoglycolate phosphatase n=1 Tax=Desulfoluna spongiiphila TaxID=419481 RepID=A0A1G5C4H2_9BACT|nr:HAD hydrolase-like protein [Desulfoluna spongiiphila]SCX97251.1 phosphoglycolate phosphatase [Desulfoluna spongiiphila]
MPELNAVFFDVDGVLLDSLPPHLAICTELNTRYNLGLTIPTVEGFKEIAGSGVPISPMTAFFRAVGFPKSAAEKGDQEYRNRFATSYDVPLFDGVAEMLRRLSDAGLPLGIVTANTLENIKTPLGPSFALFHPDCIFTRDTTGGLSKADAIVRGARTLGIHPSSLLFVGDQPSDRSAAEQAGALFLGVTYGWGLAQGTTGHPSAGSPDEITAWVTRTMGTVTT